MQVNKPELQILPIELLREYSDRFPVGFATDFEKLEESSLSADTFSFYTSVSAVFSSKIEGEQIDLDSFIKHKISGAKFLPDHTQKIDDLYDAYLLAQSTALHSKSIKQAHILLTKHILQKVQRGKVRTDNMFVITTDGKIEYVACLPAQVESELKKLYQDIELLLNTELSMVESFFFASLMMVTGELPVCWKNGFWRRNWAQKAGFCNQKSTTMISTIFIIKISGYWAWSTIS